MFYSVDDADGSFLENSVAEETVETVGFFGRILQL